jgi:REP element-mobilizing transposase RayT
MTQPRRIVPGATSLVTRRTLRRYHLFRPDPAIKQLYLYALAVCARDFGVLVHAVNLMSTHSHLVLTDPRGHMPLFNRQLNRLVSLGTKVLRKWEGPVWDHERPSVVELLTAQAMLEKLAYVIANPVTAGLVRQAQDWPGVTVRPQDMGRRTLKVRRPDVFFDPNNPKWPETIELTLSLPPVLEEHFSASRIRQAVGDEVERLEQQARKDIRARKWRVYGPDRIRRMSPYQRAKSFEPLRDRNPTFAAGRGQRAVFFRAVQELRAFRRAYREALERWKEGMRNVWFPAGTWAMVHIHCALVRSFEST